MIHPHGRRPLEISTIWRSIPPWCLALILILIATQTLIAFGDRTPWIMMTQPVDAAHGANTLLGYVATYDGGVIHIENISPHRQVDMFNAGRFDYVDFYFLRLMYALIAASIIPFIGYAAGFLLLNILLWVIGICAATAFCRRLGGDTVACSTVALLVALGSGWVFHTTDFSAHSLSFAVFYVLALVLWTSGVLFEPQSFRRHLAVGALLGAGLLAYNTTLYLLIAYAVFAAFQSRLMAVTAACVLALAIGSLWHTVLMIGGFGAWWLTGQLGGLSFSDFQAAYSLRNVEAEYFARALAAWSETFGAGLGTATTTVFQQLGQFATFDGPLVVATAVVAAVWLATQAGYGRFVAFALLVTALSVGGGMFWSQSATARGYLIYGISLFAYIAVGLAASAIHRSRIRHARPLAILCIVVIAASQGLWVNAHVAGIYGPVKAYFLGLDNASGLFQGSPQVRSITGAEPTPTLFGGTESMRSAGLHEAPTPEVEARGWRGFALALASRAYPTAVLALIGLLCLTGRARTVAFAGLAAFTLVPPLVQSILYPRLSPAFYSPTIGLSQIASGPLTLNEGDDVNLSLLVAPAFAADLRSAQRAGDRLLLRFPRSNNVSFEVRIGAAKPLQCDRSACSIPSAALDLMAQDRTRIDIRLLVDANGAFTACWQRNSLPMRSLQIVDRDGHPRESSCLPTMELHLVDPDGFLRMAGF